MLVRRLPYKVLEFFWFIRGWLTKTERWPIQVNGKVQKWIWIRKDSPKDEVIREALKSLSMPTGHVHGLMKVVVIPRKLVNVLTD